MDTTKKCPEPTFFLYLGAFVHKVEGRAVLMCILDMDGTCNKVILSVEIPPVGIPNVVATLTRYLVTRRLQRSILHLRDEARAV